MTPKEEQIYQEALRAKNEKDLYNDYVNECINVKAFIKAVGIYALILLLIMLLVVFFTRNNRSLLKETPATTTLNDNIAQADPATQWDLLIQALITVESEGNQFAIGTANDVGVLQITPIYVAEVNRILDTSAYCLDHRTDVDKSLEMFNIYQSHHNPSKNIARAIKLHNPRAGKWYEQKIMNELNKLNKIEV